MTKKLLDKFKYFGLRFLYYRLIERFPYFMPRLLDIFEPRLISRYLSKKLIREFYGHIGHAVEEKNESYIGLGMLHYDFIRLLRPQRVLCVGSYRGFVPVICALSCQDNCFGSVDFVDAGLDLSMADPLLGDGFWKKVNPGDHFSKLVDKKYIKTFVMTTEEFAKKNLSVKYDYIYLDGDHTYRGIKNDFRCFWPMLKSKGFLLVHDVLGKGAGGVRFGTGSFWKELSDNNKIIIYRPLESGLGIMQKR